MPIHDWTKVEAGIFHHFHHSWIEEIQRALNSGSLPAEYYAMAEQQAGQFGPDVLTLQTGQAPSVAEEGTEFSLGDSGGNLQLAPPQVALTAESELDFYRRKQNRVVVRHVSGDGVVAVVEIVSRGNKASAGAMRALVEKATELLFQGIHLLIIDLHPPGPRDPHGLHAALWEDLTGQVVAPPSKPLSAAAYEARPGGARAYVQEVCVGQALPDMPLFLQPDAHVPVELETTYQSAFAAMPRRWRHVLQAEPSNQDSR